MVLYIRHSLILNLASQTMNCGNNNARSDSNTNNRTAVTHIDNELKSGPISLMWTAPSHETLDCRRVEFWATVVRNYSTFWTGIKSQPYQVGDAPPGGGEVANDNFYRYVKKVKG